MKNGVFVGTTFVGKWVKEDAGIGESWECFKDAL
jgi:hypothetical protein